MNAILVIEDDQMLNAGLCYNLQLEGFTATPAYNLKTANEYISTQQWALILLDVNLPDGNGFTFAKNLNTTMKIPLIFLTAHDMDEDVMMGFDVGADDYITKPFNIKVVIQRIKAVLRRSGMNKVKNTVQECGNLKIDIMNHSVEKSGQNLALTPTEFKLLQAFLQNANQIMTRQNLLEKLWDNDSNFVDEHTLTINISRLRAKIADEEYTYIKTIYGMGYQWMGVKNE